MKQVYRYNLDFQHIPEQLSQMAQDHAKTDVDLPSLARQFYISYKRPEGFCNVLDEELQHSAEHTENGTSSFSSTKHPFNGSGDPELTGNANGKCFFSNSKMGPQQCFVQSDPAPIHFCPSTEAGIVGKLVNNKSRETESIIAYSSSKTESRKASTASDLSDESSSSNFSTIMSKPHRARDGRWAAIGEAQSRDGLLGLENFRLLKKLGCGDVGSVYLSELKGSGSYFAMKVMDKPALANRKKLGRTETEREILQCLDHPFLPTLYIHFETDKFSCLVMDFCPGGDLHTLRQKQHGKCFLEHAARFYAAEVLLALEYLHMLGIIYRDLKPENVLVREDGHIMLSDFDLSLRCSVSPTIIKSSNSNLSLEAQKLSSCDQPSCFRPRLFSRMSKKGNSSKPKIDPFRPANPLPELVAEPTSARSMSFVGTHEYLAPEIIKGEGHGSAVDWWTFGVFLYELLFGRTPYKGAGHRSTLFNIVGQQLMFPESPSVSLLARDLIGVLLVKEPQHRLAYRRGATEIKRHPFFQSVNWALIRLANPPLVPKQTIDGVIATCAEGQSSACAAHGPDAKVSGFDDVF